MKIRVRYKGRKIDISARKAWCFGPGLMLSSRDSENLVFDYPGKWSIHSFFVFFPFLAVWIDKKGQVVDKRFVNPFSPCVRPKRVFARLLEIPINQRNKKIVAFFRR